MTSKAAEFRRLLLLASERLGEEESAVAHKFWKALDAACGKSLEHERRAMVKAVAADLASYTATNLYARTIMELVAKFLVDEEGNDGDLRP